MKARTRTETVTASACTPDADADAGIVVVGGSAPPDLQAARRYVRAVHELLDWAPAKLVPVRASASVPLTVAFLALDLGG